MADPLTREELRKFLPSHRAVRAWEDAVSNAAVAPGAATTADQALANAASAQAAAAAAQADADAAQATGDTAIANAAAVLASLNAHTASTAAHGVTGAVVGTDNVQTLTNKTLDGATPLTGRSLNTGGTTPALTANKPGASTAIATWMTIKVNGTDYVIPLYLPT
jgi:hypothetical protein